ncbi:outer membrane protein [Phaeovulum sp.]|uniref:outer membrane protein n=1 Tax=Phaeovulum sp. TaxID=2934796 RepID=UPI00356B547E
MAVFSGAAIANPLPGQWDGAYWGLSLALTGEGDDRVSVTPPGDTPGTLSMGGVLGAAHLGWRQEAKGIVWGVEGDLQLGRVSDSFTASGYTASSRINQAASLRLVAGLPAGDTGLLYLTGGLAAANVNYSVSSTGLDISDTSIRTGYAVGAGYERQLYSGWNARLEYQYSNYGKTTLYDGLSETEETPDYHSLRIGLNHSF